MGSENPNYITVIGETNFRNVKKKFGIKVDDRRRHMYIIGKTGMGKSVFIESMIIQDIWAGNGLALIDPHGDTVEKMLKYVPGNRINDVIYFNPADVDFPLAFNVMEKVDSRYRHLVSSGLVGIFKKMWADSWGPRLEYLLRNAILALLEYPDSTMLGITRMMIDREYQAKVSEKVTDPVVKAFWTKEFAKYTDKFAQEAVAPIQNKVGQFLSVALIRNILGQTKSSFELREAMDSRKILLVNLSKGRIGEDISAMLGAMMITKIYLAAMSRVDMAEDERKDFYVYVDEFQNFATDSFANILSEARKYRLCLTIAHQYIEQLDDTVRNAVLGNVGTMVLFRVGAGDAEKLVLEFEPQYTVTDLINLPKWTIYLKLMIDGVASEPFSASTLPPFPKEFETNNVEKIIQVSRERYAKSREEVEDRINRWSGVLDEDEEVGEEEEIEKQGIQVYDANCFNCGVDTQVLFEPDGVRPIYCRDCLRLLRKGMIGRPNTPPPRKSNNSGGGRDFGNGRDTRQNNRSSHTHNDTSGYQKQNVKPNSDTSQKDWKKDTTVAVEVPKETLSLSALQTKEEEKENKKNGENRSQTKLSPKKNTNDTSRPSPQSERKQNFEKQSKPTQKPQLHASESTGPGMSLSALPKRNEESERSEKPTQKSPDTRPSQSNSLPKINPTSTQEVSLSSLAKREEKSISLNDLKNK